MDRRTLLSLLALLVTPAALGELAACGHVATPTGTAAAPTKEALQPTSPMPVAATSSASGSPANEGDLPIPIRKDDPVRGNRNAYVTLVVFSDFQSPGGAGQAEWMARLRSIKYGPDIMRVVFKHNPRPFHDHAAYAAEVAAGVMELGGNDAFWAFHDMAFARSSLLSESAAVAWAVEVGVPERALKTGLESHRWRSKVESDMALAKALGAVEAPCSFVNGVTVCGAQSQGNFEYVIDEELAKAKSLAARGVGGDVVYGHMLALNLEAKSAPPLKEGADKTIYRVPVGSAPTMGPATALVTIVQFADFQCPPCARVSTQLERIRREYGAAVRFVWKDTPSPPSHARALPAANFARSARAQKGDAGFWAARDKLLADQSHLEDADLERLARMLGLDPLVTMTDVQRNAFNKDIDADLALAKTLKVTQTPHFFINGRRFVGAQPFEKFKVVVDEEMERAEAMLTRGVSKASLYDALTKPKP